MEAKRLGMENIGLSNVKDVHRNLPAEVLVDHIVDYQEGRIGLRGAAMVDTGIYTGRSPDDKYIVDETSSNDKIWWGPVNRKVNEDVLMSSMRRQLASITRALQGRICLMVLLAQIQRTVSLCVL